MEATLMEAADSILYISALVADHPRPIDRVIDYFGENPCSRVRSAAQIGTGHGCRAEVRSIA